MNEVKFNFHHEDLLYTTLISKQDVLDAMLYLPAEVPGVGDYYYRGHYVTNPTTEKRYGIKKVLVQIIKNKEGFETHIFSPVYGQEKLEQLDFPCGFDVETSKNWNNKKAKVET
jgi:hypothetical protein